MCPLVNEMKKREGLEVSVCVTAQHRQMLDQVLHTFEIVPDYDLNIMKDRQTLFDITTNVLTGMKSVLEHEKPDVVLVHGDTTTAYAAALAAFYYGIPIAHVEAGLRTYDLSAPFPEEYNRQVIDLMSDWLFAPTNKAKTNLINEGKKKERVYVTGNTVIDALKIADGGLE